MNLLVTGAVALTEEKKNMLRQLGHEVVFMQQEKSPLPCAATWVEGIIGNGLFLHQPIEQFTSLRYIQLTSAGFDRVPMNYVKEQGIVIHNARGVYSIPMAEFAIAGVLQLYKQSHFFYENKKEKKWEKHRQLLELFGKKVCIIGCGSVGTECAKRFGAFGCEIVGVDLAPYSAAEYTAVLPLEKMDEAIENSDIVVLTLPLCKETHHLFNQEKFEKMKPGAVLVNIARGGIVDTKALVEALNGRLYGAVLDVFEEEPLAEDHALWHMENVIITPHNSFVGEGNDKRLWNVIIGNLRQMESL